MVLKLKTREQVRWVDDGSAISYHTALAVRSSVTPFPQLSRIFNTLAPPCPALHHGLQPFIQALHPHSVPPKTLPSTAYPPARPPHAA